MNRRSRASITLLFGWLLGSFLLPFSTPAGAEAPDLPGFLRSLQPDREVSVIVALSAKADLKRVKDRDRGLRRAAVVSALKSKADATQGPFKSFLEARGAKRVRSLWIINGMAITAPAAVIGELANLPGIESIRPDGIVAVPVAAPAVPAPAEWNIAAVRAPELWQLGFNGQGIVVANMDTGVDVSHLDLQGRWRGGTNSWYDPNGEHPAPYDRDGHGTQTMGIMAGGNAGGTFIGVAPGAQWIAVKIFNDAGAAFYSAIHLGFQWLLDPDGDPATNDAPDIVNLSWGLPVAGGCNAEFQPDVQALKAAEIFVAVASGNDGPNASTSVSPANYPESVSVGAVHQNLVVDFSSGRGPSACDGTVYPELAAPGMNIKTTDLTGGGAFPTSYAYVDGTSYAAPHVAGAAALLLQAFPTLPVTTLEALLRMSAQDLGMAGPDNDYGYGLVDAYGAFSTLVVPNFRTSRVMRPVSGTGKIRNSGLSDLVITDMSVTGSDAAVFRPDKRAIGVPVKPAASATIPVLFRPLSRGDKAATLRIATNDPVAPVLDIPLSGSSR
jgi:bacillopeptidase F